VSDSLTVHVNRGGLHSLDTPERFVADDSFDIVVANHGGATHVHLHVDDTLSEQLAIETPNHHVAGGIERRVRVTRTGTEPVRGELKVVTAHGSHTRHVDVSMTEPGGADAVDIEARPDDGSAGLGRDERRALAVGGLVVGALGLTAGVAVGDLRAMAVLAVLGTGGVVAAVAVHHVTGN